MDRREGDARLSIFHSSFICLSASSHSNFESAPWVRYWGRDLFRNQSICIRAIPRGALVAPLCVRIFGTIFLLFGAALRRTKTTQCSLARILDSLDRHLFVTYARDGRYISRLVVSAGMIVRKRKSPSNTDSPRDRRSDRYRRFLVLDSACGHGYVRFTHCRV